MPGSGPPAPAPVCTTTCWTTVPSRYPGRSDSSSRARGPSNLARPGTVERAGALSTKYDSWARLSRVGIAELAAGGGGAAADDFFAVDLEPGDVLYVPAHWWHEVVNLSVGILLSGFFGSRAMSRGCGPGSVCATPCIAPGCATRRTAHVLRPPGDRWCGRRFP
ncbi:cupin-like domain-containing protein [Streptomyces ossamyceticus]|uniref:cupin-like domain-containing protein n=1 Tax=Streptomyces ossamyceticus TaxID=249581 RepID=UPI00344732AE